MSERPPTDGPADDAHGRDAHPPPADGGEQDTFEREIEGEISKLREELAAGQPGGAAEEQGEPTEPGPGAADQAAQADEHAGAADARSDLRSTSSGGSEDVADRSTEGGAVADGSTEDGTVEEWSDADELGDADDFTPEPIDEAALDPESADEVGPETEKLSPDGEEIPVVAQDDVPAGEPDPDQGESAGGSASDTEEVVALDEAGAATGAAAVVGAGAAGAGAVAPTVAVPAIGGVLPPGAELELEEENGRRPVSMWAKFLAGSMLIVVSIATAVSVTILLGLTELAEGLRPSEALENIDTGDLTPVEGGDPQTILLIGSDEREGDNARGRSDTAMLMRLDPDKELISLFSLPRDLRANIPGVGVDRLNAAYAIGGPSLALKTIRQITGLDINHVVDVNFNGFAKAVDAVDCAYVDVDRDYFNENTSGGEGFADIDINAGYQRLCGFKALQYVRFRHTDNDVVRGARQQDFVREIRPKIPTADLVLGGLLPGFSSGRGEELIEIFKDHTTSTIKGADNLIDLLALLVASRNSEINEIRFEGQLGPNYVTASNEQMESAVAQFLGGDPPPTAEEEAATAAAETRTKEERKADRKEKQKRKEDPTAGLDLVDVSDEARRFAEIVDEAGTLNIAAMYPKRLPPGVTITEDSRGYRIRAPDRIRHRSYKLVMSMRGAGFTEYFGVTGTPWKDAPILDHPSETREIQGTEYKLYFAGDRLRMIAWETDEAVYWVNNTLLQSLTEPQMIAIATSMGSFR